ncbi:MAG: PH domain-containing protein [Turicibacter sp.]
MFEQIKSRKNIVIYNLITQFIGTTMALVIVTILLLIFKEKLQNYKNIIQIGYVLLFGYAYIEGLISPFLNAMTWKYAINEHQLQFTSGVYKKRTVVIPLNRIQHLTMIENPIANYFDVGRIQVVTTNGDHELKNISVAQGKELINQISNLLFQKEVGNKFE